MKIEVDTHTHTVLSGHAHSTILENARAALQAGLKGMVMTEHGPKLPGGPPEFVIGTYPTIPEVVEGVRIYRGIEANIVDLKGNIDISERYMKKLDFAIASLHDVVLNPGTAAQNTEAMLKALANPYIDAIGHPGNPYYEVDYPAVVGEAKRHNKLLEINNHSFLYRKGSRVNCVALLHLCREHGVRVAVSSDAHICFSVGRIDIAEREIKEAFFPKELIVNLTMSKFEAYLAERQLRLKKK